MHPTFQLNYLLKTLRMLSNPESKRIVCIFIFVGKVLIQINYHPYATLELQTFARKDIFILKLRDKFASCSNCALIAQANFTWDDIVPLLAKLDAQIVSF